MLLNGEIKNDSRVINVIKSISRFHEIDLFYISNENVSNKVLGFNEKVKLIPKELSQNYFRKIIKNTLFYNEYNFFATEVLKKTIKYDFIYANDLPCLKPAINIKEKTGSKVIYDSHEIYIETINQFFPQKAKFYRKIIYKILQKFMRIFGTFAEKKC